VASAASLEQCHRLSEAFCNSRNNGVGRALCTGNKNPYFEYAANSMKTKVFPPHYGRAIIKFICHLVAF
jgi:hypothetical protein